MSLIKNIKREEGFRALPYKDTLGFNTVGYGFKLPLSKAEQEISLELGFNEIYPMSQIVADAILKHRLDLTKETLKKQLIWIVDKPPQIRDILTEMAYQLGVNGLVKFKKTLKLIEQNRYKEASKEMLNSLWAKQTPNRAKRLSRRLSVSF